MVSFGLFNIYKVYIINKATMCSYKKKYKLILCDIIATVFSL